jgi:hypothetical protein
VNVVTLSHGSSRAYWGPYVARFCSRRCRERADAEKKRLEHERTHTRACEVCEETFIASRADARYCSNACRQDAYRKRKLGAVT